MTTLNLETIHLKAGEKGANYENMPIQIYRKYHFQKLKIFR